MSKPKFVLTKNNNPCVGEDEIIFYYTGVNTIRDGFFTAGRTVNINEARTFKSEKEAKKCSEEIKRRTTFSCKYRDWDVKKVA